MEGTMFNKNSWQEVRTGIQNRWCDLSISELDETNGDFAKVSQLIQEKYHFTPAQVEHHLEMIFERTSLDNPSSVDEFARTERTQNESPLAPR
jgi:hypothetical protein